MGGTQGSRDGFAELGKQGGSEGRALSAAMAWEKAELIPTDPNLQPGASREEKMIYYF